MADPVSRSAALLAALVAVPLAVLAGVGVFALLGGFSGDDTATAPPTATPAPQPAAPVEMTARPLTEREEIVCRALVSQLPPSVAGMGQRPVTAGAEQNAAYGEPPITVSCGVPEPEYAPTDQVWPLSGVCWYAAEEPDATVWTTLDREVPVRVEVPAADEAPGQRVTELSPAIVETIRSAEDIPTGCR